jgi:hypothetical protein
MVNRMTSLGAMVFGLVVLLMQTGCDQGQSRVVPPSVNPNEAGKKAMELYDKNGDGKISGAEFDAAPALKDGLPQFRSTVEKGITAEDIADRIRQWQERKVARANFSCQVTRNGQPVEGVEVKLVPEVFLGDSFQPATGKTSEGGIASISLPVNSADDAPGVAPGYYNIVINNVPTKYGVEVGSDFRKHGQAVYEIK